MNTTEEPVENIIEVIKVPEEQQEEELVGNTVGRS